jgi:hypothetical protein
LKAIICSKGNSFDKMFATLHEVNYLQTTLTYLLS